MGGFGRVSTLRDKARRGFRGYPVATVAYYGPDANRATKVAVGVILKEGVDPAALERWHSAESDVRFDQEICGAVLRVIAAQHVKTVVLSPGIIGCPHEEGVDYPEGQKCGACPYWADRDRWTGRVIRDERHRTSRSTGSAPALEMLAYRSLTAGADPDGPSGRPSGASWSSARCVLAEAAPLS